MKRSILAVMFLLLSKNGFGWTTDGYITELQTIQCGPAVAGANATYNVCNIVVTGTWNNPSGCTNPSMWYSMQAGETNNLERSRSIYATLLAAKVSGKKVRVSNAGCMGDIPVFSGVSLRE